MDGTDPGSSSKQPDAHGSRCVPLSSVVAGSPAAGQLDTSKIFRAYGQQVDRAVHAAAGQLDTGKVFRAAIGQLDTTRAFRAAYGQLDTSKIFRAYGQLDAALADLLEIAPVKRVPPCIPVAPGR